MRKAGLILAAVAFGIIISMSAWVGFQSPRPPRLSVTFLGYGNSPSAGRVGRFVITNSEATAVQIWAPLIEVQTPKGHIGSGNIGRSAGVGAVGIVAGGGSKVVTIPALTNQEVWRLCLRADRDVGNRRAIKRFWTYAMLRAGLRPRYQTMPYGIHGGWIEGER